MILVVGTVHVTAENLPQALVLSLEHVARSRTEPGCVSHRVSQDADNPNILVFVEEWQNQTALLAHFKVPASRTFARQLGALAVQPPQMVVYDAAPLAL
ncbi:MAG: antibiotic biosynthesis monooxygenase [Burkholderiaceae bacterium]|nr:antibiotic biosynthesis monooxygenase [Burkholderiaceae bacterium]